MYLLSASRTNSKTNLSKTIEIVISGLCFIPNQYIEGSVCLFVTLVQSAFSIIDIRQNKYVNKRKKFNFFTAVLRQTQNCANIFYLKSKEGNE